MSKKLCEAMSCATVIEAGKLMCPKHWHMIPQPLQAAISAAWDDVRQGRPGASLQFRDARRDAIRAIVEFERSHTN